MAAPAVHENVTDDGSHGQLFAGKRFFIRQRVPSRNHYVDLIKSNGGEVVLLEKKADYLIADHIMRDCPPGSISYTFIDKSIEQGEIQDPDNHLAGPPEGTARESGSLNIPAKRNRTAYTEEDDKILYKWVRDQEKAGKLANGNEIYKALESKYPRHPWQSWRDRYVKRLQYMPPSAFNIPDNAPPSPPSDTPAEPVPAPAQTQTKKATARKLGPSSTKPSDSNQVNSVEYTVDELTTEGLFDKNDWEMLYAFAEHIGSSSGEEYRKSWRDRAAGKSQTAGQWRQYFEKVVRPQWLQDSDEKREKIRKRVEERAAEKASQKASQVEEREDTPKQDEPRAKAPTPISSKVTNKRKRAVSEDDTFESYLNDRCKGKAPSAYVLFAREKKWQVWNEEYPGLDYTGLHELLMSRWVALSSEEKAPYFAKEATENSCPTNETVTLSSQAFKQLRGVVEPPVDERHGSPRPAKRRKSVSPELGTKQDPVEISSTGTDLSELTQDELLEDRPVTQSVEGEDSDIEGLDPITPPQDAVERDTSDLDPASPTPRAPHYKATAFDTQAILSSPSQGASISALPLPAGLTQLAEAEPHEQNDGEKLASDASQHTTESLEEFSQIINEDSHPPSLVPLSHPKESSPPPSPSSTGSGDPDPPLAPDEVDEYFEEQRALGFTDDFIAEALRHTRWRPALAAEVLEAWERHEFLPKKRGIWSDEDDEDVESGDGMALARLERLHTVDGWGGITERLHFLARYRDAKMS